MRQWRIGTITAGLTLIALGGLLLYSRINGSISVIQVLSWWPMVLVVFGAEVLLSSLFSSEQVKIKFDGFSIFLIVMTLIISAGVYFVSSALDGFQGIHIGNAFIGNSKYRTMVAKGYDLNADGKSKLYISNIYGDVKVEKGRGGTVKVDASISISNNDEEYAKSIMDSLIDTSAEGETIKVVTESQKYANSSDKVQSISIDYIIKVPENMDVEIENGYGRVDVSDLGRAAKITSKHGDVAAKSVKGSLVISNAYAKVEIEKAGGNVEIKNTNASVRVTGVDGNLNLTNAYGSVNVDDVKGDTQIENNNANIDVRNIGGKLVIESRYCRVDAEDVKGSIEVKGNNASMKLKDIAGDVDASNRYGSIDLTGANQKVTLSTNNASIDFEAASEIQKDVTIENSYGSISLSIPKTQGGSIKASTKYGSINSDFGSSKRVTGNEETLEASIGTSSINFNIENRNGNINISRH